MRLITKDEIVPIAEFIAKHCKDMNIHRYFFPDDNTFSEKIYYLYLFYCTYHFKKTYISDDGKGAIILHSPNQDLVTPSIKEIYASFAFAAKLGMRSITRLISYQTWVSKFTKSFLTESHYYLDVFAVDYLYTEGNDKLIRNSTTDELMNSVIEKATSEGYMLFTETYSEKDLPFFLDYNFKLIKESLLPGTEFTQFSLILKK